MSCATLTLPQVDGQSTESVAVELPSLTMTVAEIIRFSVQTYASEMIASEKMSGEKCQQQIRRRFLTEEDVSRMSASGKVAMPQVPGERSINLEREISRALEAFTENVYFLLVDGRQLSDLADQVEFKDNSKIFFLRLVPLAGG